MRDRHCAYQNKVAILVLEPVFPGHVLPATQFDGFGLIRPFAALSRIDRLLLQPHFITSQHDGYDLGGPETVPESDRVWDLTGKPWTAFVPLCLCAVALAVLGTVVTRCSPAVQAKDPNVARRKPEHA